MLLGGGYGWLDTANRVLMFLRVVSTLATTVMILPRVEWGTLSDTGWILDRDDVVRGRACRVHAQPARCLDHQSMWTAEAEKQLGGRHASTLADTRRAFRSGCAMTAVLAVCFCIMGAGVMHAARIAPVTDAPGFAAQVIGLYGSALGEEAAPLAAIAALSVMLTTVLAGVDVSARNIASAFRLGTRRRGPRRDRAGGSHPARRSGADAAGAVRRRAPRRGGREPDREHE
jgi:hypothetical protein